MDRGNQKIKVLVVDDHPSVVSSVVLLVQHEGTMGVIGTASNAEDAIQQTRKLKPDLILMDVKLPGKSGIEATREICSFDRHAKVLVYSGYEKAMGPALAAGAQGFLNKGNPLSTLITAMKLVASGGVCIDGQNWASLKPDLLSTSRDERSQFTEEEWTLTPFFKGGVAPKEIALRSKIEVRRVYKLRSSMMQKLKVKSPASLALQLSSLFPEDWPVNGDRAHF